MLCDVAKVHTGFGLMPRVTHCTEDATWGQVGGSRKVFMARTLTFKGGEAALDRVLERIENQYWKIEISDMKAASMGIVKFQGEWQTRQMDDGNIEVLYTYTVFTKGVLLFPLQWLFTKLLWRTYMKQVINNIKELAYSEAPYLQD